VDELCVVHAAVREEATQAQEAEAKVALVSGQRDALNI
jgi:hypothetical protein